MPVRIVDRTETGSAPPSCRPLQHFDARLRGISPAAARCRWRPGTREGLQRFDTDGAPITMGEESRDDRGAPSDNKDGRILFIRLFLNSERKTGLRRTRPVPA